MEVMIVGIMVDADTVLIRGNIITVDSKASRAEAVAIKNGRLLWVGSTEEVKAAIGKGTEVRDLKGMTIVPGFNEAHNHTLQFGHILSGIILASVRSIDGILDLVRERAVRHKEGTWISGSGFDQNKLREKRLPTRWDLDQVAPNHPVSLKHTSMHAMVVNSRALSLAGITKDTPDPEGGEIGRDHRNGELTGILLEFPAMNLIENIMPKPSQEDLIAALKRASEKLLSEGITSATDAGVGVLVDVPRQIAAYQEAVERGALRVRHNLAIWSNALFNYENFDEELKKAEWNLLGMGIRSGLGNERLRIGPFKFVPDGALSSGTAVTYEAYGADPNHQTTGVFVIDPEKLAKLACVVHAFGWQLMIHAIGDRTLDTAINAIEKALQIRKKEDPRPRIEHCVMITPSMIEKFGKLGICLILQPGFVWGLGDNYISQLGRERASKTKPFRTLLDNNIIIAFSSDRPVIDGAPLLGIHAAVNQKTMTGQDYAPEEKISAEEALGCYTINGAYTTFEEKIKGSLEAGKLADLVILAEDPTKIAPESIKDVQVVATMVGGEFLYEK
jgi:predicted amidohydrolase YtcJ